MPILDMFSIYMRESGQWLMPGVAATTKDISTWLESDVVPEWIKRSAYFFDPKTSVYCNIHDVVDGDVKCRRRRTRRSRGSSFSDHTLCETGCRSYGCSLWQRRHV